MLLLADGTVVYSASDLSVAADCEFALLRALDGKLGRTPPVELAQDAMLARLAELGDRHERQVLARLRHRFGPWDPSTGRGVVEIARPARADSRDPAALSAAREQTLAALRGGADVVFQAGFFDGRFSGWADFVVRSDDGAGYTVHDAKLARRAKVTALLQLAAYADQLLADGVPLAEDVHLVLGDRTVTDHRLDDLLPVYRVRRARLQHVVDAHVADDGPVAWGDERFRACLRCEVCTPELEARRDVLLVAGVRTTQRARLAAAGITTVEQLAAAEDEVAGMAPAALATLRAQARLQAAQAAAPGTLPYELFAPDVVGHLPPPDPGDIFFDFEGDPLWVDEHGEWGLEYLFGVVEAPTAPGAEPVFRAFWAHDRAQERQALLDFLAYVAQRRASNPGMHVYHYAAYEKTALLRLAGRHGVGEEDLDQLLRGGVLVDLYQVVRGALRIGNRSYSLKKLEPLYMAQARSGDVQTAGESVVEYAEACDVRDLGRLTEWEQRLARIADYNSYDCRSTLGLRDWLVARAAEAGVRPGRVRPAAAVPPVEVEAVGLEPGTVAGAGETGGPALRAAAAEQRAAAATAQRTADDALAARLLQHAGGDAPAGRTPDQQAVAMLGAAVGYHRREAKPFWWAHFDRLLSDPVEWTDRRNTFLVERADVVTDWHTPPRGQVLQRVLRLVGRLEPGSSIAEGADVHAIYDPPVPDGLTVPADARRGCTDKVTVRAIQAEGDGPAARDVVVVVERVGRGRAGHDAVPMALSPGAPPAVASITAAIRALAQDVADGLDAGRGLPDHPALDLLRRRPPYARAGSLPVGDDDAAITAALVDLAAAPPEAGGRCLAVQGPPGTGKTYTGARVIAALVARGWRIGVVGQSHAVVENMLREVAACGVAPEQIGKKPAEGGQAEGDDAAPWQWVKADHLAAFQAAQPAGYVVGGTAWDLTNPTRLPAEPLDLMVVDEAGQFALADTVAVATSARALLLLGDPQQLPQVTQGRHPEPVDCSALGWLTDGRRTLPPHLGYFLARTWRMHPTLCEVVSRLSYERRLHAVPATAARSLDGVPPGLECVTVAHTGNAVASVEEAAEVVAQVCAVLGRTWHDPAADPADRPLEPADVVVVAAYNAQVWTVRRALDAAGLGDVRVGTVDRFQGQQAVVAIATMAASSPEDVPRGMEFLLDRNRVNVAISRAQWRAVLIRSAGLTDYLPAVPDALAELGAFLGLCAPARQPG